MEHAPEADEDRLSGIVSERCRTRRVRPVDDAARERVGDAFRLFARALIARKEKYAAPFLGAHALNAGAVPLAQRRPVLGERAATFQYDVRRVEGLVQQSGNRALES